MLSWIQSIDIISLIIGALLGAFLSTWHAYWVKRPILHIYGAGGCGSSGLGFHTNHITFTNPQGLLGWRIRESVIFGIRLHRHFEVGLVIDRSPAHECRAFLFEKKNNQIIKQLTWRIKGTQGSYYKDMVTIESGQQADLMLFARLNQEKNKYFVYEPTSLSDYTPKTPDDDEKFNSSMDFVVEIWHSYGRKKLRFECRMIKGLDGKLSFQSASGGGGSF
jgi:hypothetical protein